MVREQSDEREKAKCELEQSLEKEYRLIILEPPWLGDQALRQDTVAVHRGCFVCVTNSHLYNPGGFALAISYTKLLSSCV